MGRKKQTRTYIPCKSVIGIFDLKNFNLKRGANWYQNITNIHTIILFLIYNNYALCNVFMICELLTDEWCTFKVSMRFLKKFQNIVSFSTTYCICSAKLTATQRYGKTRQNACSLPDNLTVSGHAVLITILTCEVLYCAASSIRYLT